jgi:hypothetical protein
MQQVVQQLQKSAKVAEKTGAEKKELQLLQGQGQCASQAAELLHIERGLFVVGKARGKAEGREGAEAKRNRKR